MILPESVNRHIQKKAREATLKARQDERLFDAEVAYAKVVGSIKADRAWPAIKATIFEKACDTYAREHFHAVTSPMPGSPTSVWSASFKVEAACIQRLITLGEKSGFKTGMATRNADQFVKDSHGVIHGVIFMWGPEA